MNNVISLSQRKFDMEELKRKIPKDYLIVFFSPVEWIDDIGVEINKYYENSIGASSYKDITKEYVLYESVSFIGIKCEKVKLLLLKDVTEKIITYYEEVESLKNIYRKNHSVLLEFTDGLTFAEESVLTVLTNELPNVPVVGGSVADNGQFLHTKVCVNGECLENATGLCMLTTSMEVEIYCENIYEPTKARGIITDSDLFNRKIYKINNKPAVDFYAEALNINKDNIESKFRDHPIARILGNRYYVTSIMKAENGGFNVYTRSFNHSFISVCNPINYKKLWNEKKKGYIGGIFINCLFRTMLFEKENTISDFQNYLKGFKNFICMTSYGEQYNDSHVNQTMVACLFK